MMELKLEPNPLHSESQTLLFDKVATLIGENGSGKSSILQSIFDTKLDEKGFDDLRVVCFSSGQNENFSRKFSRYINKELRAGKTLNLKGFFFDKSWSKLLIFLATCLKSDGKVREFLRKSGYVEERGVTQVKKDDISSNLIIKFRVTKYYAMRVQDALRSEESGEKIDTLRSTPYFRSLTSFIETNVDSEYDFERPLRLRAVKLTSEKVFAASYVATRPTQDNANSKPILDDPTISFFTQAASNNSFINKNQLKLNLKGGLELDQLSDGEFQLLFLYALIDLFDDDNTLFLLDEADSHLHYKNIENLWCMLGKIKGNAITTTHLLDSIIASDFSAIKVVEKGRICEEDKLKQLINRLRILSRATSVEYEVCAKITMMALLDDYNDWIIFIRLVNRKGLDENKLKYIQAIKESSGFNSLSESIGESKLNWAERLGAIDSTFCTTHLFLICDRDELPLKDINGVLINSKNIKKRIRSIKWPKGKDVDVSLLAWKRREIKNYLLSFTALSHHGVLTEINSDTLAVASYLKKFDPGDNEDIRKLNVKKTINPLVNRDGYGLCPKKLQAYIDLIPPDEISEDIENMYNFIVSKL